MISNITMQQKVGLGYVNEMSKRIWCISYMCCVVAVGFRVMQNVSRLWIDIRTCYLGAVNQCFYFNLNWLNHQENINNLQKVETLLNQICCYYKSFTPSYTPVTMKSPRIAWCPQYIWVVSTTLPVLDAVNIVILVGISSLS